MVGLKDSESLGSSPVLKSDSTNELSTLLLLLDNIFVDNPEGSSIFWATNLLGICKLVKLESTGEKLLLYIPSFRKLLSDGGSFLMALLIGVAIGVLVLEFIMCGLLLMLDDELLAKE